MNPQIILNVTSGSLTGTKHSFDTPGTYAIGREENRDVAFPDTEEFSNISRHHCDLQIIQIDPPNIKLTDRNSTQGTFINGHKISGTQELLPNQVISIGNISVSIALQTNRQQPDTFIPESPPQPTSPDPATIPTVIATPIAAVAPPPVTRPRPAILAKFLATINKFLEFSPIPAVAPPPPTASEQIEPLHFPDYQLGKSLGKGVVSEVYLATHQESGKSVALKTLQPQVAKQAAAVQKFISETEYTRVLDHPHLIKLLDLNYTPEALFYTTEYCTGGSLFSLMQQLGGQLPAVWAKSIILQILDGLDYIHQLEVPYIKMAKGGFGTGQGLVHRSLKPENILLTTEQGKLVVKISDFALAQALNLSGISGQKMPAGSFAGTPHYMSRAQVINFQETQPAADIWAAVACLYEMLTGQTPRDFDDRDPSIVIMEQPAISIGDRITYLPPSLVEIIDKALHEEPDHRTYYQNAIDFKTDLLKVW
jgi:eukaryotic-like serine/threonine-protein kinase